jgi:hypothetical protein
MAITNLEITNFTNIKWNDSTREKIMQLRTELDKLQIHSFLGIGHPSNHTVVHSAIINIFPTAKNHKPDMYAVYIALACEISKATCWEELLEQFTIRETYVLQEDDDAMYDGNLTCICAQKVGHAMMMLNPLTGEEVYVGSVCAFKVCITDKQVDQYNVVKSRIDRRRRELAGARKREKDELARQEEERRFRIEMEERARQRQIEREEEQRLAAEKAEQLKLDTFICCRKCKEYVIPKGTFTSTTCHECRIFREGYKKCIGCGFYKIKKDKPYYKCFECNKPKKNI